MSVIKNCTDIWSRLFDHKSFVDAELNSFIKEFQESRQDKEVENLLDSLNVNCEIKNEYNKIFSSGNVTSQLLTEKVDICLAQAQKILKSNKTEISKRVLEIRKQQREKKWRQLKRNMEPKYLEADIQFIKQQETVKKFYEEQQNKLKVVQVSLR